MIETLGDVSSREPQTKKRNDLKICKVFIKPTMYSNGKIYRIVCKTTGNQYVGSTIQPLSKRLSNHVVKHNRWKNGKTSERITSSIVLENDNFHIILIEPYSCSSKRELEQRERYWIEKLECVNKTIPYRTNEELKAFYKDYHQRYRIEHNDEIKERERLYREANREKKKAYLKEYHRKKKQNKK